MHRTTHMRKTEGASATFISSTAAVPAMHGGIPVLLGKAVFSSSQKCMLVSLLADSSWPAVAMRYAAEQASPKIKMTA